VKALVLRAPDGTIHYIARDNLESWNGRDPPRILATLIDPTGDIDKAEYLSEARILLTFGAQTRVWDLNKKSIEAPLPDINVGQFALSGDRRFLAVSDDGGFVHLWDMRPGNPPIEVGRYEAAPHVALNHDGSRIAISDVKALRLLNIEFAGPFSNVLDLARRHVARHLTPKEEDRLLPR
jgi:WD40 repeat protein